MLKAGKPIIVKLNMRVLTKLSLFLLCCCPLLAICADVTPAGSRPVIIPRNNATLLATASSVIDPKVVMLQKLAISTLAHQRLSQRASAMVLLAPTPLPEAIRLGMNNTPVLDQGMHGTCVMFAVTGAIDALIGQGDHISQLCSLTLGTYLEQEREIPFSGWDGSLGRIVIDQLLNYGIVPKTQEHSAHCGGLKQYPLVEDKQTGQPIAIEDYANYSVPITEEVQWQTVVDIDTVFRRDYDPDQMIDNIKTALSQNHRVIIGSLLDIDAGGIAGAVGSYHTNYDTWMLTHGIRTHVSQYQVQDGHEMIITGFDDDAVVYSDDGTVNQGLFKLRNSWGRQVGDHGDFYMSYDHAKLMILEAQALMPKQ